MFLIVVVLAVLMIGPLLLERLERHVPSSARPGQSTVKGESG